MRSKRILLHDTEKLSKVNDESLKLLQRYRVDMAMRNLSEGTQLHYVLDLEAWFIWILENQGNKSVREINDDDITEFLYFCKSEGNNAERATLLKNAGMPLEDVSVLLNHESTQTTKKFYIKEDTARISSVKSKYNI